MATKIIYRPILGGRIPWPMGNRQTKAARRKAWEQETQENLRFKERLTFPEYRKDGRHSRIWDHDPVEPCTGMTCSTQVWQLGYALPKTLPELMTMGVE